MEPTMLVVCGLPLGPGVLKTACCTVSDQFAWPGPPARPAYSHSNSLGSRYAFVCSILLSFFTNSWACSHVIVSTGCLSTSSLTMLPWKVDGLVPITFFHCPWVTSYLPM